MSLLAALPNGLVVFTNGSSSRLLEAYPCSDQCNRRRECSPKTPVTTLSHPGIGETIFRYRGGRASGGSRPGAVRQAPRGREETIQVADCDNADRAHPGSAHVPQVGC